MGVKVFCTALDYSHWVNYYEGTPITIISVVVFDDSLVVTYKTK
jgi:hypothetical protein